MPHIIPQKTEHYSERYEEENPHDHVIPDKREHFVEENENEILDDGLEDEDLHKLPKEMWTPSFHGGVHPEKAHETTEKPAEEKEPQSLEKYLAGVDQYLHESEDEAPISHLTPRKYGEDDPRFNIPHSKYQSVHDHVIMPKETAAIDDPQETYGQSYEFERKEAYHPGKKSAGLAPKNFDLDLNHPCNAEGSENLCEGMTCVVDSDCASECCS